MQISQIYITDTNEGKLTDFISDRIKTVKHYFSHCDYVLYDGNTLRQFIEDNFDSDVLWAYDCLKPYAYKTDLGKYCILYKLGGWYADVTTDMINYPNIPLGIKCILFRDTQTEHYLFSTNSIANNIMYAEPGLELFLDAIKQVIQNCKNNHYGLTPVCPTGPNMLGSVVARYNPCNWIHYGAYTQLTPGQKSKNSANIMADGLILAISKGTISLAGVGLGTNNYTTLWRNHQVYTDLAANLPLKNLYRFILQREPDNTGIIAYNNKSFDEVKNILLASKEHHSIDQTTSITHRPVLPYTIIKVNNRANDNLSNTKNILSNLEHIDLSFFDAAQQDVTNFYDKRSININWNYDRFNRDALQGEYGVAASQILVCEYIVEHNIKEMIVFEDDAVIDQTFLEKFYACYNSLPTKWDYLADSSEFPHHSQFEKVTNNILIDSKIICKADLLNAHLGFMLYSNQGARKLLNAIKFYGFNSPIDTFIYDLTKSKYLNGYCTFFQNKLLVAKDLYGTLIDTNNIRR